ncbi:MAG: DUF1929 domain-containing protein [Armatimonas sp.]
MANLGNAWHIPAGAEPQLRRAGMRDPIGALVPGSQVTIFNGNQFQGDGNTGNQLQVGSSLFFKRSTDTSWKERPLLFARTIGNNKYYSADLPTDNLQPGDVIQYYLQIAYDDHDQTFLGANATNDASVPLADTTSARATPFTFVVADPAEKGRWSPVFPLPNVGIHAHLLPTGNVLLWGRRDNLTDTLDEHVCTPFVWDPKTGQTKPTVNQPARANGTTVNLFCSGHAFLPDGRLLVVGGHLFDGDGLDQAILYDAQTNMWSPTAPMGLQQRRWYPTVTSLPDGGALVLAGSYVDQGQTLHPPLLQIWRNDTWTTIPQQNGTPLDFKNLPLYPRMHVLSSGQVFMSGPNAVTQVLKTSTPGAWTDMDSRQMKQRDYCPSVLYRPDKVIYIGGGNDPDTKAPTDQVEVIDLTDAAPEWRKTQPMHFRRRQHNGAILADGSVLVTGGTRGGGGLNNGFNDLGAGEPVHTAELWDPNTELWTELASEEIDRCYHATTLLLPDATVLSAGGGEYRPDQDPNDPLDSHRNAQIFSPPYLFQGARPILTAAPTEISYGNDFSIGVDHPDQIGQVSWIRLASVTHSFDQNQRIHFLTFALRADGLNVTPPASPNECPPGHYMLFALSKTGIPSEAMIIRIDTALHSPIANAIVEAASMDSALSVPMELPAPVATTDLAPVAYGYAAEAKEAAKAGRTRVVIGITGTCPYGIGACWGGAYEALTHLKIDGQHLLVDDMANTTDSTGELYMAADSLPVVSDWQEQFRQMVNGTYAFRGVEVTVRGRVEMSSDTLRLASGDHRGPVELAPLTSAKIQWDRAAEAPQATKPEEASAYNRLVANMENGSIEKDIIVTGLLRETDSGPVIEVRQFLDWASYFSDLTK